MFWFFYILCPKLSENTISYSETPLSCKRGSFTEIGCIIDKLDHPCNIRIMVAISSSNPPNALFSTL